MKPSFNKTFNAKSILFLIFLTLLAFKISTKKVEAQSIWERVSTLNFNNISVLESTPYGILVGVGASLDSSPSNAIYLSKDFGKSWQYLGLKNRRILDLKYFDGKIYATTFYTIDNTHGLFYSYNMGETWENLWLSPSPTKIDRDSQTIYLGTEHYGIYTSSDEGLTWNKIFEGSGTALKIYEIQSSEDITLASTGSKVYKTTDYGSTWQEITALANKGIASFLINGNTIFAGSSGTPGLYISSDLGETWDKVSNFGSYAVNKIIGFENKYYAGRYNPDNQKYSIFVSTDGGYAWQNTGLDISTIDKVNSLNTLFSNPPFLLASIYNMGLYKYEITDYGLPQSPFLNIPWNYENENELVDNITSFFDHSYPLLGYSYHTEPEKEVKSTFNFLGIKNVEPNIYYSSHSGYDFGLRYGTSIIAPASGYASYYYCKDCGNSIKIDHQNGYQTTYMHLQETDLITKNETKWVDTNQIIGKVGLTGRTTGPHLHFEVIKDNQMDGIFTNDFPTGRTDPFGWQTTKYKDPWKSYTWDDVLGNHSGSSSQYLWNIQNKKIVGTVSSGTNSDEENTLTLENINVKFDNPISYFTTKIFSYIKPASGTYDLVKSYIKNTSFILESFDQIGDKISYFNSPLEISVLLDPDDFTNINISTLSLYFWNEITKTWEAIPSFFDEQSNKVSATVSHLSWFAVFGEKTDQLIPETQIIISGSQEGVWFTEKPLVLFYFINEEPQSEIDTFYSINEGETWKLYTEPFYIEQDGIVKLIYKSQKLNGVMEEEHEYLIHINLYDKPTKNIKVVGANFET